MISHEIFAKTKEEREELRSKKLEWNAKMRRKYNRFTKKRWARNPQDFPQE